MNTQFFIEQLFGSSDTEVGIFFFPLTNGTVGAERNTKFTAAPFYASEVLFAAAVKQAVADWANSNGYTGVQVSDVFGL